MPTVAEQRETLEGCLHDAIIKLSDASQVVLPDGWSNFHDELRRATRPAFQMDLTELDEIIRETKGTRPQEWIMAAKEILRAALEEVSPWAIRATHEQGRASKAPGIAAELIARRNFLGDLPLPNRQPKADAGSATAAQATALVEPSATSALTAGAGWRSHSDLAKHHGVDSEKLRKRLETWRRSTDEGYTEVKNRRPREPQFLYEERAVLHIIQTLKAAGNSRRPVASEKK